MLNVLQFLRVWVLVSVPLGILVGKLLRANREISERPKDRR